MRFSKTLALIGVVVFSLFAGVLYAQDKQADSPKDGVVAVVTARSANAVLESVGKAAAKIDEPAVLFALAGAQMAINLEGPLGGFDTTKPLAIVVCANQKGYIALPVKNIDFVKRHFFKQSEGDTLKELDDSKGLFEFVSHKQADKKSYLRLVDGWLFVSETRDAVPDKICPLVADTVKRLNKEYLIAIQFSAENIAPEDRLKALADLNELVLQNCPKKGKEKPAVVDEVLRNWGKKVYQAVKTYVVDGPSVVIGLSVDEEKGILVEAKALAPEGTKSAKALNKVSGVTTNLAGFYQPDSDWAFRLSGKAKLLNAKQIDEVLNLIGKKLYEHVDDKVKDPQKNEQVKKDLVALKALVADTMDDGIWDCALSAELSADKGVSVVSARYSADGYAAEEFAGELFNRIKGACPDFGKVLEKELAVNVDNINGTRIHTLTIPVPEDWPNRDKVQKFVGGKKLTVAVAFGKNLIGSAIGGNALENLKTALKNSESAKKVPVYEFTQRPLEMIKTAEEFCPSMKKWSEELKSFKASMGKTYEKCGLERFEVTGVENGVALRYNLSWSGLKTKVKSAPYIKKIQESCKKK